MSSSGPRSAGAAFRRFLPVAPLDTGVAEPASNPEQAAAKLAELMAADVAIPEATRTRCFEPDGVAVATVVIWHGFTNAPSQFALVGEALAGLGYRVLVPRMPRHGEADVLTKDLAHLTSAELITHAQACVDIAAGWGAPVWVVGLSAGATLAAWVAAMRTEVSRVVLAAPLVAPKGFPLWAVRLIVRFPRLVPKLYFWWDPRKKADLGHSPYAYPGFPMAGIVGFLQLSEGLFDLPANAGHQLERAVLISNPGDFAIRRDAALSFARQVCFARADVSGVAGIDASLKWMHDFVDPYSPDAGSTEQVVAILLAALGVGEPTAGGVLVPPLVAEQAIVERPQS